MGRTEKLRKRDAEHRDEHQRQPLGVKGVKSDADTKYIRKCPGQQGKLLREDMPASKGDMKQLVHRHAESHQEQNTEGRRVQQHTGDHHYQEHDSPDSALY